MAQVGRTHALDSPVSNHKYPNYRPPAHGSIRRISPGRDVGRHWASLNIFCGRVLSCIMRLAECPAQELQYEPSTIAWLHSELEKCH